MNKLLTISVSVSGENGGKTTSAEQKREARQTGQAGDPDLSTCFEVF